MPSSSHPRALASQAELLCVSPTDSDRASATALAQPRAKCLPRTPHSSSDELGGALLRTTREARGLSRGQVARAWRNDERVVRDVESGRKAFTVRRLMSLPRPMRQQILDLLQAISDAPPVLDVEGHEAP